MIWNRTLFILCITLLVIVFVIWRWLFYVPLDWVRYTNTKGEYSYSFSYPKEWIVIECGNGEVIVAKRKFDTCYPESIEESYFSDIYFRVFPPKSPMVNYKDVGMQKSIYLGVLKDWKLKHWYPDDFFDYKIISSDYGPLPVSAINYPKCDFKIPYNQRSYPCVSPRVWFDIGYMANNLSEWDIYSVTVSFKDH